MLPLFLLWGATRLGKVAKADPERKFAVDPARKKSSQQSQPAAPKKSIRERAAMQAREDVVVPEKQDTVDEENICRFRRVKLETQSMNISIIGKCSGKIVKDI